MGPGVEGSTLCQPSPLSSLRPDQNRSFPPELLILPHGPQARAQLHRAGPRDTPQPPLRAFEA